MRAHSFCGSAGGLEGTEPCALQRELARPWRWQAPRATVSGRAGPAAAVGSWGGGGGRAPILLEFASVCSAQACAEHPAPRQAPGAVDGSSRQRGRGKQDLGSERQEERAPGHPLEEAQGTPPPCGPRGPLLLGTAPWFWAWAVLDSLTPTSGDWRLSRAARVFLPRAGQCF